MSNDSNTPVVARRVTTVTTSHSRVELGPDSLRALLASAGVQVPPGATFEVEHGCSAWDLPAEVREDNPLVIEWSTTERT